MPARMIIKPVGTVRVLLKYGLVLYCLVIRFGLGPSSGTPLEPLRNVVTEGLASSPTELFPGLCSRVFLLTGCAWHSGKFLAIVFFPREKGEMSQNVQEVLMGCSDPE